MAVMFAGDGGGFAGVAGSSTRLLLPSAGYDYDTATRDVWRNSAVWNGLQFVQTTFVDPELRVTYRRRSGVEDPVSGHEMVALCDRPNPYYSGKTLWKATVLSYFANGNAYWLKSRGAGGAGRPVELWYLPHYRIWPWWPMDGSEFLSGYVYYAGGKKVLLAREDVVHFRCGLDPYNERLGLSPLHAVLREVYTDNEAATYSAALLRNCGVPGVAISPKDPAVTLDRPQREELVNAWTGKFGSENAGSPFVSSHGLDVSPVGFSPEQLALDKLRTVPEERIAGALQIPAALLQFGAGMDRATYSNLAEYRKQAFDSCIIPTQSAMADDLQHQLLPEFGNPDREKVGWDYADVRYLQENETDRMKRAVTGYRGGVLMRSEARSHVGHESGPEDNVYHPAMASGPDTVAAGADPLVGGAG